MPAKASPLFWKSARRNGSARLKHRLPARPSARAPRRRSRTGTNLPLNPGAATRIAPRSPCVRGVRFAFQHAAGPRAHARIRAHVTSARVFTSSGKSKTPAVARGLHRQRSRSRLHRRFRTCRSPLHGPCAVKDERTRSSRQLDTICRDAFHRCSSFLRMTVRTVFARAAILSRKQVLVNVAATSMRSRCRGTGVTTDLRITPA
jgi:hypothetical protein